MSPARLLSESRTARFGAAAFALGLLHTLVSVFWAVGGTTGLDTVGGELERLGRERDPLMLMVIWLAVALKLTAATLGLAVAREWGRRLPRWLVLTLAWGAATVLVLYGGVMVIGQALVKAGVFQAAADMDWTAFHWHLFLWDPSFLLWGLLLGAATWGFTRRHGGR